MGLLDSKTEDVKSELFDDNYEDSEREDVGSDIDTNFANDAQVVRIWLDTEPYLNNLYLAITNQEKKVYKLRSKEGTEKYINRVEQINGTTPLLNNLGVSQLMGRVKSLIHGHIAQGNIKEKQYHTFMYWFRIKIMKMLLVNRKSWAVTIDDCTTLSDLICDAMELYLTRPIDNLERDRDKKALDTENNNKEDSFWERTGKAMKRGRN